MKEIVGEVVSSKMTQTAVVSVKRFYRYPLYGKIVSRKSKIHAHNSVGAKSGQLVAMSPCRPYAKTVAFQITRVISTGDSVNPVVQKSDPKLEPKANKGKKNNTKKKKR